MKKRETVSTRASLYQEESPGELHLVTTHPCKLIAV